LKGGQGSRLADNVSHRAVHKGRQADGVTRLFLSTFSDWPTIHSEPEGYFPTAFHRMNGRIVLHMALE